MRIIHFIYDHINNPWVGGGGAVRAFEIYRRLAKRHQITIVCGKYPGATDSVEGNPSFKFSGSDKDNYALSTFSYVFKAINYLRTHKGDADIIVEDFAPYNPIFSKFVTDKPVVLQVHHKEGMNLFNRYSIFGIPFMIVESLYPRLYSKVISVSEESRKKFSIDKAVIIPNGTDQKLFETTTSEADYIAFLGRLQIHNKGLDTLVQAMSSINIKLAIAGSGKDEGRLSALINRLNTNRHIELIGYLSDNDKIRFIANAKIIVLPSRYEGQGIVVLEAAACGKPVIVSDIPELRYAVDAGFGISFRKCDSNDLTEKVNFLLNDESKRKEMGGKAREYAKNFTWDKIAEEYERFLIRAANQQ
jgi:glycogen synthase